MRFTPCAPGMTMVKKSSRVTLIVVGWFANEHGSPEAVAAPARRVPSEWLRVATAALVAKWSAA